MVRQMLLVLLYHESNEIQILPYSNRFYYVSVPFCDRFLSVIKNSKASQKFPVNFETLKNGYETQFNKAKKRSQKVTVTEYCLIPFCLDVIHICNQDTFPFPKKKATA